jgi:hypothetical protein
MATKPEVYEMMKRSLRLYIDSQLSTDVPLGNLAFCAEAKNMVTKTKYMAVADWIQSGWTMYKAKKAVVQAIPEPLPEEGVIFTEEMGDFSAMGAAPYGSAQVMNEIAANANKA